jgi:beta-lactam-binding protein with PASTA domain
VEVPNLSGLYQPQAADELQKRGLGLGKETMRNSDQVPRGQILDQDPHPGTIVTKGGQISIVTSLGPAIVDLSGLSQTVKGKTYDDVAKQLTDLGLRPGQQMEQSADVDAGKVTRIDPSDKVAAQGNVTVYVSTGKPTPTPALATATVTATPGRTTPTPGALPTPRSTPAAGAAGSVGLPNVIGKTQDEATQLLQQQGFTNFEFGFLPVAGAPKQKRGQVVAIFDVRGNPQQISPGTQLPKDTPLVLVLQQTD